MSVSLQILKLFSSRLAVQVLSFLTVPIITRLFLPEHFGVLQIFDSIAKILILVVCLKYELAIPLARDDTEAIHTAFISGMIAIGFTLLVTGCLIFGRETLSHWLHIPEFREFLWFLPIVLLTGGINIIGGNWASRKRQFGAVAWADVGNFICERGWQIGWGMLVGMPVVGLFLARLTGTAVRIIILFVFLRETFATSFNVKAVSLSALWDAVRLYKKFPLFTTWATLLNNVAEHLPVFFLSAIYSQRIVGFYSLGLRSINLPMRMLHVSIAKVFFPEAAKEYRERGVLTDIVTIFFTRLVQISIFPMAVLTLFGPSLFMAVFGAEWHEAGRYAQWLGVWSFFVFMTTPLRVFLIVDRQEADLVMNVVTLTGSVLGLWIGSLFNDPLSAVACFVLLNVACQFANLCWKLTLSHVSVWWAIRLLVRYITLTYAILLPVTYLVSSITLNFVEFLGILSGSGVIYILVLLKSDSSFREFVKTLSEKFAQRTR